MGPDDQDTVALPQANLLNGRYLVGQQLGQGGFGSVYLAQDQAMHGRPVVVKIQSHQSSDDAWLEKKFHDEVRALSLIDHPGVVSAIDSGRTPEGKAFLVMQYVDGVTLRAVMTPKGMPLAQSAEILKQMGHALAAAHEKGIWHRDLKPENLMLQKMSGGGERVRLIDFGVATVTDLATDLTTTRVAGSLLYMAPEQRMGQPSAAADIYAMGLIAFEMLTGQKPFSTTAASQVTGLQKAGVQQLPTVLRPSLAPRTEQLILQSLEFDPAKRPGDAREFGEELYRSLVDSDVTRVTSLPAMSSAHGSQKSVPRMRWVVGTIAALFIVLVAVRFRPGQEQSQQIPIPAAAPRVTPPAPAAAPPSNLAELNLWNATRNSTERQAYLNYLQQYPNGQFAGLAASKLALLEIPNLSPATPDQEKNLWNATKKSSEAEVYEQYLDKYPEGKHAAAARKKLESLDRNEERNQAIRHQIDVLPELSYWKQIQKRNSADAYAEYLKTYPNGLFAPLARVKQSQLAGRQ